jgi:hypothetical protein
MCGDGHVAPAVSGQEDGLDPVGQPTFCLDGPAEPFEFDTFLRLKEDGDGRRGA